MAEKLCCEDDMASCLTYETIIKEHVERERTIQYEPV
jgi:hypothetical protein